MKEFSNKSTANERKEHDVKNTFSGLHYKSVTIFISLAVVTSQICEITRNSEKNKLPSVQGLVRSSILVPIESEYATCISH